MKQRVAIICGGRSSEHEISCISAGGVLSAIDRNKYEPVLIGISKTGKWFHLPESHRLTISNGVLPEIADHGQTVALSVDGFSASGKNLDIDIVFPLLHGPYGEDGTIQGLLEIVDISYVGSGVLASAAAMDKSFAKPIFASIGIKVATGFVVRQTEWQKESAAIQKEADQLGYPLFVKPARGGSSRGATKVKFAADFAAALAEAFKFDTKALVEEEIRGAEIECAVLEIDGVAKASLPGQIKIDANYEFYDFTAKYLDGATTIELPAPIDQKISDEIRAKAVDAFISLGCSGLARVDFFLTPNGEVIINELNTMPGFTATSAFPKMWSATGVLYTDVITHLLKSALTRNNGVLGN
ncbi:MAG: D-alanine--D-alanine ligase family protein [Candidatus Planktophila sp.]|jgi:D-alanine-D-alanine ligase